MNTTSKSNESTERQVVLGFHEFSLDKRKKQAEELVNTIPY